jgi:MFS transporter, PAT family, beta-lactamase induction signal transducer AmpG
VESPPTPAAASHHPWRWVPSLYFAQGIPNVVVTGVSVVMLKRLGLENAQIAFYTSLLGLPWVLKPLWSPLVQRFGTRRGWTVLMQLLVGAGLAVAALALPVVDWVRYVLAAFAFVAIASATHDVAADGFYLLALSSHEQAWFVGIRSTAFRLAMVVGSGMLVMLAGNLESNTGLPTVRVHASGADRALGAISFDPARFSITDSSVQAVEVIDDAIDLSLRDRDVAEVDALRLAVRRWNVEHDFYVASIDELTGKPKDKAPRTGFIAALEDRIRTWFGPRKPIATEITRTGDATIVWMRLSQAVPAGAQQVVQFGLAEGDPSFKVLEGERFTVTPENSDQPFAAVVQVEDKLEKPSSADFEIRSGNIPLAWMTTLGIAAGLFALLCAYHYFVLPYPPGDRPVAPDEGRLASGFIEPFLAFFRKPKILALLAFLLLYRLPEAQLVKLATPFLIDPREKGGLALTTGELGFAYGTVGVIMLTLGGITGGIMAARNGLKRWLWPMAVAIHLPNAAFLFLAYAQPESLWTITAAVGVEQFGYGFGFTAYMLYCIYIARGEHQTVHYALCTGAMALGMMIPGMWSGWLQQLIGYEHFFVWVMICTIPSFATVAFIPLDAEFGKKSG